MADWHGHGLTADCVEKTGRDVDVYDDATADVVNRAFADVAGCATGWSDEARLAREVRSLTVKYAIHELRRL